MDGNAYLHMAQSSSRATKRLKGKINAEAMKRLTLKAGLWWYNNNNCLFIKIVNVAHGNDYRRWIELSPSESITYAIIIKIQFDIV